MFVGFGEGCWCGKMGSAEEGFRIVWKRWMERILSENPSAKCPFSYIIMEKGGYWVGVYYDVMLWFFSLQSFFSLSLNLEMLNLPCGGCFAYTTLATSTYFCLFLCTLLSDWVEIFWGCVGTGWWGKLHLISATSGSSKSPQNVSLISPIIGRAPLML